jgi:hypothetical protein
MSSLAKILFSVFTHAEGGEGAERGAKNMGLGESRVRIFVFTRDFFA